MITPLFWNIIGYIFGIGGGIQIIFYLFGISDDPANYRFVYFLLMTLGWAMAVGIK